MFDKTQKLNHPNLVIYFVLNFERYLKILFLLFLHHRIFFMIIKSYFGSNMFKITLYSPVVDIGLTIEIVIKFNCFI